MSADWLLLETLGPEPAVVARGRQLKNLLPLRALLRRSPHLDKVAEAVAAAMRSATGGLTLAATPDRVIRTEPVLMSDGRVHGVQVWLGAVDEQPPERPTVGAVIWDLTTGVATRTAAALAISGMDPATEMLEGRSFADDLPRTGLNPTEITVLSKTVNCTPGDVLCLNWDVDDYLGNPISVAFVARANSEILPDGSEHLISRAMNWRGVRDGAPQVPDNLAQRILSGLAQPGVHRALVDLRNWAALKWLDEPCPFYDWRPTAEPMVHPDDEALIPALTADFERGEMTGRVLRLRRGDGWAHVHVTVNRVDLDDTTVVGLISLRLPTDAELQAASRR